LFAIKIYNAIEKELNFNERYYMSFLEQDRGSFVPLLAFSHLSRCNFIVFLGDRVQGHAFCFYNFFASKLFLELSFDFRRQESIVMFDFAPTPFPVKTFALGCLSRDKFYALKNVNEEKAPKLKDKMKREGRMNYTTSSSNVIVID
jgi:hypothetical protein